MARAWGAVAIVSSLALGLGMSEGEEPKRAASKKIDIEGFVFDSSRKPLLGVEVGVYVTGKKDSVTGTKIKDVAGRYSLKAELSDSFSILFSKSNYRPCVMKQLVEGQSHRISLVLDKRGEPLPAGAAHAYLQSVDRLVFLALTLPMHERRAFLRQFTSKEDPHLGLDKWAITGAMPADLREVLDTEKDEVAKRFKSILP